MKTTRQLTAIIEREDDAYVALCPELDIASQGATVEIARTNLIEAVGEIPTTVPVPDHSELKTGTLSSIIRQSGLAGTLFES